MNEAQTKVDNQCVDNHVEREILDGREKVKKLQEKQAPHQAEEALIPYFLLFLSLGCHTLRMLLSGGLTSMPLRATKIRNRL